MKVEQVYQLANDITKEAHMSKIGIIGAMDEEVKLLKDAGPQRLYLLYGAEEYLRGLLGIRDEYSVLCVVALGHEALPEE